MTHSMSWPIPLSESQDLALRNRREDELARHWWSPRTLERVGTSSQRVTQITFHRSLHTWLLERTVITKPENPLTYVVPDSEVNMPVTTSAKTGWKFGDTGTVALPSILEAVRFGYIGMMPRVWGECLSGQWLLTLECRSIQRQLLWYVSLPTVM